MENRVRRSIAEKRRIVELTLEPGASVARAEGVNSHQVFNWRRAYRDGRLVEPGTSGLLPVVIADAEAEKRYTGCWLPQEHSGGSIHIEIPERALISAEPGADSALLRTVLELLRK